MGKVVLCNNKQTACVLVYPVDNAGAYYAVDARKAVLAMIQKRVDQRFVIVACGRVNNHSLRLVDNKKIVVLISDVKRNVLRRKLKLARFGNNKGNFVAGLYLIVFADGLSPNGNCAAFRHFLNGGTAELLCKGANDLVYPFACRAFVNGNYHCVNHFAFPFFPLFP